MKMSYSPGLPRVVATFVAIAALTMCSAHAADAVKTLRLSSSTAETSYDNAFASDESSQTITERITEPMLEYHYLARPAKLTPRTLEALPTISDNGATFLCKVQ